MFTKIDKKVLIASIMALILIVLGIFALYKYSANNVAKVKTPVEQKENTGISKTPEQTPEVKLQNPAIEVHGTGAGTLTICTDKCGDGICQKTDPNCKSGDLNCICIETSKECPQDCK